ncbi:cbb3-type cytochrome oxidase assembly protein CcoS [Flammeovirga pectinis]|uniref:Cbb3-type cytochrome oxidase assembly protein CcoS n=1 Tax=Flammeovirga pectinis TaxID=2494373 RepID=A0A3S9NY15_9BACT|nr:cbb3-type cytochrome oxidase assembly protein CcoS [Flammeovirga pectinis]AZQ60839.1 cbb3-type cytochrome oxidase assembly protein CcoS [Flammeovirga pectinis]
MSAIIVLIGISLIIALTFLAIFIWSVKSNQYEDTYTPSIRILFEEDDRQRTAAQRDDKR